MTCLICSGPAKEIPTGGHFFEMECQECGHYGIPKLLVKMMSDNGSCFDVGRVRQYLRMRVENKEEPWITPVDINNYQLLGGGTGDGGG